MPTKVNASHILVKGQEQAQDIYSRILDGESFADLAMKYSLCPSKKKGGNLGWFGHGQMVKEFERAAFTTKKGEMTKPVKTQFGWHIIKVNDAKG